MANKLSKGEQATYLRKAQEFRPPFQTGRRYFTDDEEELFVVVLEEAHDAAFPFDRDALKHLATRTGRKIYGNEFKVDDTWVRRFEKR